MPEEPRPARSDPPGGGSGRSAATRGTGDRSTDAGSRDRSASTRGTGDRSADPGLREGSGDAGRRDPSADAGTRAASADPGPQRRLTDEERVERAFFRGDRLVSIPARVGKRAILLPIIRDRCFPEDRDYEEKEVNMRLALLHPDVAALRRYLVDEGLMTRTGGIYRRAPDTARPASVTARPAET